MRWSTLIPIASIVSTSLAFSVIWWATQRRKERESYYRYELARLMVERFADGPDRVMAWLREQEQSAWHRRRDGLRLAAYLMLFGGIGALVALRFTTHEDSAFGWIPIGFALALFIYLFVSRKSLPVRPE